VNQDFGKKTGLIDRTAKYEVYVKEKIGSDNFTKRHA